MDWRAVECGIAFQFSFAKIRIFLHLNKNILHVYKYLTCRSDCCLCVICEGKIQWICAVKRDEKNCLVGGRIRAVWSLVGAGLGVGRVLFGGLEGSV